jgi:hypothetical protein
MHVNIFSNGDQALHCGGCDAEIEKEDHYITLIGKELNKTYEDISFNSASNDQIVRTTIDWFESGNTADFVIIHFTEDFRVEYIAGHDDYQICTPFGVKNHQCPPDKYKDLDYYYENIYNPFIGSDNFYKNQFLLELYFEKKNIPYFFLKLMNIPTPSPWKTWCKTKRLTATCYAGGLIDTQENKPDNYHHHHPSEKGHQIIADYILDNIRDQF